MWLASLDVPELDGEVARSRGKDILGGGVEEDLSDLSVPELARGWYGIRGAESLPRMARELRGGAHVGHLLGVDVEGEVLRDLPDEDPAVIRARCDNVIIERVPARGPELVRS